MSKQEYFSHSTALIDESVKIGGNTKIWHFTHVMSHAQIGRDCSLGQNVFVGKSVVIGNGCKIQNNVSLFEGVICEDHVFIGPSVVFTNVINPRAFIERKDEYQDTLVMEGASIGANVTVLCGVNIGAYSMIGAGAVITKDVPNYGLFVGNPAKQIGWISRAGATLQFKNGEARCSIEGATYALKNEQVELIREHA